MKFTRQQARAEERRIQKHIDKMAELEASTKRLVELGVLKKKWRPLKRVADFIRTLAGRHGEQKGMR